MTEMISHYLKLATRALVKNKYYTFINIFGLVFGMLSALIIAKYVGGSLQFDNFHQKRDSIYSVLQEEIVNGNSQTYSNSTYWGVGDLARQYPDVLSNTRYNYYIGSLVIAEDYNGVSTSLFENKIFSVDSSFLNIFTFPLIHGDATALSAPSAVVLTHSASRRYFGDENPVGRSMTFRAPWGKESSYEVRGVLKDHPLRSQFDFDFLVTNPKDPEEPWYMPDYQTFLLVKENADVDELSASLTDRLREVPELKEAERNIALVLRSLADVQLSTTEYLLIAVGIFIVLISWVNYINQLIAQSYWRMKEISILRVMGATRANLKTQFIVEAGLVCFTSLIVIVAIYAGIEPSLQSLTNSHLLPLMGDPTPINWSFLVVFITGVILAAAIPAVVLFHPNFGNTLRNSYSNKVGNVGLRQALVVVQYSVSTILMISVFVISGQLDYMSKKDKGLDMENVLIVQNPIIRDTTWDVKRKAVELFKEKCAQLPFVAQAASSTTIPSEEYRQETYLSLEGSDARSMVHQNGVDEYFFELYNVEFIAGGNFVAEARWKNRTSIILNQSAARVLGIADPEKMIGARITDRESGDVYDLVGIVKDYHQTSLKYEMRPIAFKFNQARGHFSLKLHPQGLKGAELDAKLMAVKDIWVQTYRDAAFEYFFLNEKFAAQDREDQYFGKLFSYFTVLSIVISCLGLFGLSLLISTKRQREIGVRKVFGASSASILGIFIKSYLKPLAIAIVIGSPLAYMMMQTWLSNYAYKIEMGVGLFAIAWVSLAVIFLLAISYHAIKASVVNPIVILRD
jgi:putative ABC transport system permease protein